MSTADLFAKRACGDADPEVFFPFDSNDAALAKAICKGDPTLGLDPCPVRLACLEWALEHGEHGVWGGTTEYERRRMKGGHGNHACHLCENNFRSHGSLTTHLSKAHEALPLTCRNNHPWADNEHVEPNGRRKCRTCRAEYRESRKAGAAA